jgi:UDP-N-acetylglucosamine--N-acetylmuramyl-(pentapeptide) pyrophosphoryl-undecaprenol N-acetylglucosamine transferase
MKLVVSGGGTGGHVYPALAVVASLLESGSQEAGPGALAVSDVLWIGSQGGIEEGLVRNDGLPYVGLQAGGLRGKNPLESMRNAVRISGSVGKARSILAGFEPDVVFATGGYACVAVTLAARTQSTPVLIYLPDIVPGKAVEFLSRFAAQVAVTSEESRQYLPPGKTVVTGYPVRANLWTLNRAQAQKALGLDEGMKTLLVFGGSRGARSINCALVAGLRELLPVCQVVHVSGRLDAGWVADAAKDLPSDLLARYHYHAYLHDMPQALVAADLAVARAGAATLGEFPAVGLPSILVPYPHSGQHQYPNAAYMARRGASCVIADAELAEKLVSAVLELFKDAGKLASMKDSAAALARPDAAEALAEQLLVMGRHHGTARLGAKS